MSRLLLSSVADIYCGQCAIAEAAALVQFITLKAYPFECLRILSRKVGICIWQLPGSIGGIVNCDFDCG